MPDPSEIPAVRSPRAWADELALRLHKVAAANNDGTVPMFLNIAEQCFADAIASEAFWLAEYLQYKAEKTTQCVPTPQTRPGGSLA